MSASPRHNTFYTEALVINRTRMDFALTGIRYTIGSHYRWAYVSIPVPHMSARLVKTPLWTRGVYEMMATCRVMPHG